MAKYWKIGAKVKPIKIGQFPRLWDNLAFEGNIYQIQKIAVQKWDSEDCHALAVLRLLGNNSAVIEVPCKVEFQWGLSLETKERLNKELKRMLTEDIEIDDLRELLDVIDEQTTTKRIEEEFARVEQEAECARQELEKFRAQKKEKEEDKRPPRMSVAEENSLRQMIALNGLEAVEGCAQWLSAKIQEQEED